MKNSLFLHEFFFEEEYVSDEGIYLRPDFKDENVKKLFRKMFNLTLSKNYELLTDNQKLIIDNTISAIEKAEIMFTSLPYEIINMDGMSAAKNRIFLNHMCSYSDVVYFEIGIATGSTHIAALWNNDHVRSFACDIWLESKNPEGGEKIFLEKFKKYSKRECPTKIFSGDCFSLNKDFFENEKINLYFYDGGHSVKDHIDSILYFEDIFDDEVIVIIDDWADSRVQEGTLMALMSLKKYDIFYWEYIHSGPYLAPFNVGFIGHHQIKSSINSKFGDKARWWNGVLVLFLRRKDEYLT